MTRLLRLGLALLLSIGIVSAAHAAVTITFWSHDFGSSFPHAFFTLRGTPNAGGAPVDVNYGFTAKTISPAILMGTVAGRLDTARPVYIQGSDAQFSVVLTDAQYAAVLALTREWGENGDHRYNLNKRNCVHFVREAARRSGVAAVEFPALMKKPRSYLKAVAAANGERVTVIGQSGSTYLATPAPAIAVTPR
jgi:hypothetical protein